MAARNQPDMSAPQVGHNLGRSREIQERAGRLIPGMTQLLSKRPDQFSLGVWPAYYSRAEGAHVWDLDGNRYLDMSIAGIGANVLGYADPDVNAAVIAAVQAGVSTSLNCPEEVELAELLCELHPWAEKVRFARSGGEAMTVAVRIARAATGRDVVAFCGYHGWHDWYLAANLGTENALGEHLLPGLDPLGVPKALAGTAFPFGFNRLEDLEAIAARQGDRIAAIVMEPRRGEMPKPGFLEGVKAIARRIGAVLVFDEISSGFRIVTGGTHLTLGVAPDIAVFSKAMGNGFAIAAIIGTASAMDAVQRSFISSTMWTERVGPAAALATIRKHRRDKVGDILERRGRGIQAAWREAAARHGVKIEITGFPAMSYIAFANSDGLATRAYFIERMMDRGILAGGRYYAMAAHTEENVAAYSIACDAAFASIAEALAAADLRQRLRGAPSASGFKRIA